MKKIICFLTAMVMALSLLTPTAFAEGGVDLHPDPFDSVIELDEEVSINLADSESTAEYTFTPDETGYYVFYTLDDADFMLYFDEPEGGRTQYCSGATLDALYKLQAGFEYTLEFSYFEEASTFEFGITTLKIASIEVTEPGDQTYIYGVDSEEVGEAPDSYQWFDVDYPEEIEVTFNNGDASHHGDFWDVSDFLMANYHISLGVYDEQSLDNQWTVGNTYKSYVIIGMVYDDPDIMFDYDVEIVENEVVSLSTSGETPKLYKNISGNQGDDAFIYDLYAPDQVIATLKDGTVITGTASEVDEQLYDLYGSGLTYSSDQEENPWGVGTHQAILSFGDVSCTYDLEVVDNPVASIEVNEVKDAIVYYHVNGQFDDDSGMFIYDYPTPSDMTVTLTDSSTITGDFGEISDELFDRFGGEVYTKAVMDSDWEIGTQKVEVVFGDNVTEYEITVAENPIVSITCADTETDGFYSYFGGETIYYHYTVDDVTVVPNNAQTITGDYYEVEEKLFDLYGWALEYTDNQHEEQWTVGQTYEANLCFGDVKGAFNVTVGDTYDVVENEDGDLVYEVNGELASDYTGYVTSNNLYRDITPSLYYVKDGYVDTTHTGFYKVEVEPGVYQWRYYVEGVWQSEACGFATDEARSTKGNIYRYRVDEGLINFHYNGYGEAKGDRYYVDGRWMCNYTGFADYTAPNGAITKDCYYVKKGVISQGFNGLYKVNGVYKYYRNGKFQSSTSGFAIDTAKYKETGKVYRYRIDNGLVNKNFTGFAEAGNSRYYKNGLWQNNFTGKVNVGGKTYNVVKGIRK